MKIGPINIIDGILLAPMEDVTDRPFRIICKRLGADIVYTEFVNADGLVRSKSKKTREKLTIEEEERPIAIQIYGSEIEPMMGAAAIAESANPDFLNINAGCWIKDIVKRGAGAGLLRDLPKLQLMAKSIVENVKLPVTVKTRLGWDADSIQIVEAAKMLEDVGIQALTIHCRTRSQGHKGEADWSWITEVKKHVSIPVIANGDIDTPQKVEYVLRTIGADAVMIGRGAIDHPWIFRDAKHYLKTGELLPEPTVKERIALAIEHLKISVKYKGDRYGTIELRKHYSGYLRGLYGASKLRIHLMQFTEPAPIEDALMQFAEQYNPPLRQGNELLEHRTDGKLEFPSCQI